MPDLEEVFQEVNDEVSFLGVSLDYTRERWTNVVAETGVTYQTGWDENFTIFETLGLFAMPTTLFVGQDGIVVEQWNGILSGDLLRDLINENLL